MRHSGLTHEIALLAQPAWQRRAPLWKRTPSMQLRITNDFNTAHAIHLESSCVDPVGQDVAATGAAALVGSA